MPCHSGHSLGHSAGHAPAASASSGACVVRQLTDSESVRYSIACHHSGGMYSISPGSRRQSRAFANRRKASFSASEKNWNGTSQNKRR